MLWQGCSLSPRELERKATRSVWATQLPASRPIRWIVRESREANRTDSPAFYRTNFARAPARQSDGLTFGIPSPASPRTDFARIRKADADSTISKPDMDAHNRSSSTSQTPCLRSFIRIYIRDFHLRQNQMGD